MSILVADRVQETTSTTGTGTITLAGALAGYQSFSTAFPSGGQVYYGIVNGVQWEVGYGTFTVAGTTLSRTNILASSNGGTAITLAGTSNVFCDFPASLATILTNTTGSGNVVLSTGATLVTPNIGAATSSGIVATTTFAPAFTDGTVMDYTTGIGRISVGTSDVINLYTGGVASSLMASAASTGFTSTPGLAALGAYTTTFTDGIVADYATGNGRISVGTADTLTLYSGGVASTSIGQFATTGTTLPNGVLAVGTFSSAYTDGTVVDYATGNGRISVGSADTITLYTGGIATTSIGQFASTGATLPNGILSVGTFSSAFTDGTVVDYATGNGRISVGAADTLSIYNGGIANTLMAAFSSTGLSITGGFSATTTSKMTSMAELGKVVVNNNAAGTYTVPANTSYVAFTGTNATTIAFTFPAAAASIDGLEIEIYTTAAVSVSSTWASTGATFVGAPATLGAGSLTKFIYNHATTQWLPRG